MTVINAPAFMMDKIFELLEDSIGNWVMVTVWGYTLKDRTCRKWFRQYTIREHHPFKFERILQVSHDKRGVIFEPWTIDFDDVAEVTGYRITLRDGTTLGEVRYWNKKIPAGGSILITMGIDRG